MSRSERPRAGSGERALVRLLAPPLGALGVFLPVYLWTGGCAISRGLWIYLGSFLLLGGGSLLLHALLRGGGRRLWIGHAVAFAVVGTVSVAATWVFGIGVATARTFDLQRRSISRLRELHVALERYREEHDAWPVAEEIETLAEQLEPFHVYADPIPRRDSWGHPLAARSGPEGWILASAGCDGTFLYEDLDAYQGAACHVRDPRGDLVTTSSRGGLLRFPRGGGAPAELPSCSALDDDEDTE